MRRTLVNFSIPLFAALCAGHLTAIAAEPQVSRHPRPASVTATIGDLLVRIDGPKLWTISRIEYKGTILGVEESAYGTVLNIKNVGFIGTAHKEVEAENVTDLRFLLDDKPMQFTKESSRGKSFTVVRKSHIRSFQLDSLLTVSDNKLYQSVRLQTAAPVDMKVIYPFMYAWTPTATDYLYAADDGTTNAGKFRGKSAKQGQLSTSRMSWLAVYDQPSGTGVVSRLLSRHKTGGASMLIVDSPGVYRKFYVMCFADQQVPAGFDETYQIVSTFFKSEPTTWKTAATKLAATLTVEK